MALGMALLAALAIVAWPAHGEPVVDPGKAATKVAGGFAAQFPEGAAIYEKHCAACHDGGALRAPARIIIGNMTPAAIHASLVEGVMQMQGNALSDKQKIEVAQYLSGQVYADEAALPEPKFCAAEHRAFDVSRPPAFAGWGIDQQATHAVPVAQAGLGKADLPRLKVKWTFGFPGANRARSQPALGGGAIFVGSHNGQVYALDRETGCVRWVFKAGTEVRTGIVLSPWTKGDVRADPLVYFGDLRGNVYALHAFTGEPAWTIDADEHPAAVITAAPALYDGTLYVGVSSLEEASAAVPGYPCCTFRGSILALDAATGRQKWRKWMIDEPKPQAGGKFMGPAGMPVWAGLAVDPKRGHLLIATGGNYSGPATDHTDSIMALDLATGEIDWTFQAIAKDVWNVDCIMPDNDNCPENAGPDYNFGTGPVLARGKDGRDYVVDGQKEGSAYALDPDTGKLIWTRKIGRGSMIGGTHFGVAAVDGKLIVPISDAAPPMLKTDVPARPGVYALDIVTGEYLWQAPAPDPCEGRPLCLRGYSGAVTVTSELLFAGGDDGFVRIYDMADGKVLWEMDTVRDFDTVNDVPARGGAISGGAAPIVDSGQLIVSSGYGFASKLPGNALIVLEAE
ncbi:pyrrolo-quinoline quinone [Novosphingobium sp. PC22D]|nr:pyrrolo-quinoline quinone [Novosphingobium sp. PC22D]